MSAATELHDAIDRLEMTSVQWAPGHSAPFVSKYLVLPLVDFYTERITREAVEPLLARIEVLEDAIRHGDDAARMRALRGEPE